MGHLYPINPNQKSYEKHLRDLETQLAEREIRVRDQNLMVSVSLRTFNPFPDLFLDRLYYAARELITWIKYHYDYFEYPPLLNGKPSKAPLTEYLETIRNRNKNNSVTEINKGLFLSDWLIVLDIYYLCVSRAVLTDPEELPTFMVGRAFKNSAEELNQMSEHLKRYRPKDDMDEILADWSIIARVDVQNNE
jgi:hypothetical protein